MKTTIALMSSVSVLGLAVLFGGCGSDDGDGSGGTQTVEQFSNSMAELTCEKIFECCPEGNAFLPNETACTGFISGFMASSTQDGVDHNLMTFDGSAASDCIATLRTMANALTCEEFGDDALEDVDVPACNLVTQGLVAEGESCEIDSGGGSTISSDSYCQDGMVCGSGVCLRPSEVGGSCEGGNFGDDCIDGYCNNGVCAAYSVVGAACDFGSDCASDDCTDGVCVADQMCE